MGQLRALGVQPGGVLLVHTALSRVGTSPYQLIEGLLAAVGADGTLVMPSMADDDDVPFDRKTTPCRAVGIVADTFWRMPGVLRSDSLLLGVGHDADTTVHVAENIAGVRYRQPKYATVLEDGQPRRYEYGETDHCCQRFALLDEWLGHQQKVVVIGNGHARLARSRDIVAAALARLRENETIFLHAPGACGECDAARAGAAA